MRVRSVIGQESVLNARNKRSQRNDECGRAEMDLSCFGMDAKLAFRQGDDQFAALQSQPRTVVACFEQFVRNLRNRANANGKVSRHCTDDRHRQ